MSRSMPIQRRLFAERLEDRALLAGDIAAAVVDGSLVITGDAQANGLSISQLDASTYALSAFELNGSATTLNGSTDVQVFTGVTADIDANLGGGDDLLVVGNDLAASATLATQLSGQTITIAASAQIPAPGIDPVQTAIAGDLNVEMGTGDDNLAVSVDVGGSADLRTSIGHDAVVVASADVAEDLIINTNSGDDSVEVTANVGDLLFVNTDVGVDSIEISGSAAAKAFIDAGLDADDVTVIDSSTELDTTIFTRTGDDTIDIDGYAAANLIVNGGQGNNSIEIDDVIADANLVVTTYLGSDIVAIGADAAVDVATNLLVTLGGGNDSLNLSGAVGNNLLVFAGAGNDNLSLTDVSVGSTAYVAAGLGADIVTLVNVDATDRLFAYLGLGNDSLSVQGSSSASALFHGVAGVDTYANLGGNAFARLQRFRLRLV